MTKEFKLDDERRKLVQILRNRFGIHNSVAWSIVKLVVEQDKEFIRLIKEIEHFKNCPNCRKEIDKLSGNLPADTEAKE